jgi:hypothetical protein
VTPAYSTWGGTSYVLTWANLIPGSYTVTETDPGNQWTVVVSGSPATVPTDGGQASASVTNTHKLGSLQVTKTVNWNGVTPVEAQTFEICISGPSYPNGSCQVTPAYSTWGGTSYVLTWANLIPGSYTVTETDPGNQWTVEIVGSPASVPAGGTATAMVTNTRTLPAPPVGALKVTKVVNWSGVTPVPEQTFEICIKGPSYPRGSEEGACQVAGYNGAELLWEGLTPGTYILSETDPDREWTVDYESATDDMGTTEVEVVVVEGRTARATIRNTRVPESPPTAVSLDYWNATGGVDSVTHEWKTAFEKDLVGFRLYRSAAAQRALAQLVAQIPAQGAGIYTYTDAGLAPGTYYYWLVEVLGSGEGTVFGPKEVRVGLGDQATRYRLYVPILLR